MDKKTTKTCTYCGSIITGRSDKKFCDTLCRNAFNNKFIKETEALIARINSTLRKNRSLLKQLNPIGRTLVRKEYLMLQGFNFNYFTHIYKAGNGNVYYFCYEYGYFIDDAKESAVLVTWQKYMQQYSNQVINYETDMLRT